VVLLAWLVKTTSMMATGTSGWCTGARVPAERGDRGDPGIAVVAGSACSTPGWVFVMIRFDIDEEDLGPGQVHV
jgi:uncharacterized membrane protein